MALTVGSASDEPFKSMDDMYFRFVSLLRIPWESMTPGSSSLIYASDQHIFGLTLPIPGIVYAVALVRQFMAPSASRSRASVQADQVPLASTPSTFRSGRYARSHHLGDLPPVTRLRGIRLGQRSLLPLRTAATRTTRSSTARTATIRWHPVRPAALRRRGLRRLGVRSLLLRGRGLQGPTRQPDRRPRRPFIVGRLHLRF